MSSLTFEVSTYTDSPQAVAVCIFCGSDSALQYNVGDVDKDVVDRCVPWNILEKLPEKYSRICSECYQRIMAFENFRGYAVKNVNKISELLFVFNQINPLLTTNCPGSQLDLVSHKVEGDSDELNDADIHFLIQTLEGAESDVYSVLATFLEQSMVTENEDKNDSSDCGEQEEVDSEPDAQEITYCDNSDLQLVLSGHNEEGGGAIEDAVMEVPVVPETRNIDVLANAAMETIDTNVQEVTVYGEQGETVFLLSEKDGPLYICEKCEQQFSKLSTLQQHMHSHKEYKPYICEICSKTFFTSNQLKVHLRWHSKERPYRCVSCHSSFVCKSDMVKHYIAKHTGFRSKKPPKPVSSEMHHVILNPNQEETTVPDLKQEANLTHQHQENVVQKSNTEVSTGMPQGGSARQQDSSAYDIVVTHSGDLLRQASEGSAIQLESVEEDKPHSQVTPDVSLAVKPHSLVKTNPSNETQVENQENNVPMEPLHKTDGFCPEDQLGVDTSVKTEFLLPAGQEASFMNNSKNLPVSGSVTKSSPGVVSIIQTRRQKHLEGTCNKLSTVYKNTATRKKCIDLLSDTIKVENGCKQMTSVDSKVQIKTDSSARPSRAKRLPSKFASDNVKMLPVATEKKIVSVLIKEHDKPQPKEINRKKKEKIQKKSLWEKNGSVKYAE